MIAPESHRLVQRDRLADIAREARRHPLAGVHPLERRASGRMRRRLALAERLGLRAPASAQR